ncbi:protein kinase [Microbispora sp. NPDC049125]|uniref:serine/threonine-protein kinase n=1 Tax=Microbispora sp. NPDC049125 TaxID=3154929 RepID=UPI003467DD23
MALQAGDPVALGPFELVDRLGEGGQGVVYLGRGPAGEQVAVKLLHTRLASEPEARQRFLREVALARRVARFCTAPVLHADLAGNQPYIVSEYVPGPSLRQLVEREGPRRGAALERLAISTATALAAIHRAGITHRDFKPANVLMGPEGPVVIDFGVARALDSPQATATGATLGTPAYLAPELLSGGEATGAADVFAWGVTMVFAATGRPAFGADTIPSVITRILNSEPDLGTLAPPLRDFIAACLSKDPALRPTAEEVVGRLTGGPTVPVQVQMQAPPAHHPGPSHNAPAPATSQPATSQPGAPRSGRPQPGRARPGVRRPGRRRTAILAGVGAGILVPVLAVTAVFAARQAGDGGTSAAAGAASPAMPPAGSGGQPEVLPIGSGGASPSPSANRHRPDAVPPTGRASQRPEPSTRSGSTPPATPHASPAATRTPARTPTPAPSPKPTATRSPSPAPVPNPFTAAGVCGPGFAVVGSHSFGGRATTYLLYQASTGKNCVVTLSRYKVPGKVRMGAVLKVKGGASGADWGRYTAYAGPLRLTAKGTCVMWGGGYGTATWSSAWSHCG